jgi:threonine/homoserine/homoserine lactone efflux protein
MMILPEWSTLVVFVAAALVLLVIPGPAVLYIITRSIDQGRLAGLASVFGIEVGTMFHVVAAGLGLSALLMTSALAFKIVKFLGALYLIYLGIRKLVVKEEVEQPQVGEHKRLSQIFIQGVVVNLLNPKLALFFLAFLPQFADPSRGPVAIQIILLGLIFEALALCSDSLYALLAGTFGHWLKGNTRFLRGQRYFAGSMYILLGLTAAVSGSDSK